MALLTRGTLLAQGFTDDSIRSAVRAAQLRRVWSGVYTRQPPLTPWDEYRLTVRAAALGSDGSGVVSHQSAGALWRMPMLLPDRSRVHTTIDDRHGGGITSRHRHIHPRPLRVADTVVLDGVPVTSRARTAVDIAMAGTYEQALAVIDGVRRIPRFPRPTDPKPVSVDELSQIVEHLGPRRGHRVVKHAIADSVAASESVGESWSRARMLQWRLPMPSLQEEFRIDGRSYFADFRWGRLVGEFDGDDKYESDSERRRSEKRRDGDFGTLGITVCHWTWQDLTDRHRFFAILTRALVGAGVLATPPPFPG